MADRTYVYKSKVNANWDREPKVEGRVAFIGSEKIDGKVRPLIRVETEKGEVTVWESEGLKDLFAAVKVGFTVSIECLGMVETQKGRQFRQFRSQAWIEDGAQVDAPRLGRKARR